MKTFPTRTAARIFRSVVNAKAVAAGSNAKLKDPVKVKVGSVDVWTIPAEINHGSKLTIKRK